MVSSLRIASALLFFFGAHLIVPRIADAAAKFKNPRSTTVNSIYLETTKPNLNQVELLRGLESEYEPPNYGGPNSEYGSGTR